MKKLLSICVVGLLLLGLVSATESDLRSLIDTLNDDISFGYTLSQKVSVEEISVNKIVIKSPVIQDELGNVIKKYTVIFSQYPLSEMMDSISLIDEAREKTFEFTTVGADVLMDFTTTTDGISPSSVYYLSVIPKDEHNIFWELSNEIRFKLATQTYGDWVHTDNSAHAAAGANMSLAHVAHTISNNTATLRWTAVGGSDKIDMFVYNPTSSIFERLASVNMSDEIYSLPLTRNGEYIVNFVPNNNWTEHRYTFVADGITSAATSPTTPPTIWVIPATGPKENILIVLAISVVLYFIYRKVRAKH